MGLGFSPGDGEPSSYCWARPQGEWGSVQELMISSLLLISALKSSIISWLWLPAPFHIFLAMSPLLRSLSVCLYVSQHAHTHTHTRTHIHAHTHMQSHSWQAGHLELHSFIRRICALQLITTQKEKKGWYVIPSTCSGVW